MDFSRTSKHLFIDNNSTNTVEFFLAANSYLDLAKEFTDDLATFKAWEYTFHTHDPITKQAEFFDKLARTKIKNKDNTEGSINTKVEKTDDGVSVLTSRIDQFKGSDEVWVRTDSGEIETRINEATELQEALSRDSNCKLQWKPIEKYISEEIEEQTSGLSSEYGQAGISEQTLLYWMEKFRTSHQLVQKKYKELLKKNGTPEHNKETVFQDFSDTVGYMHRILDSLGNDFTIPLYDEKLELFDGVMPASYNAIFDEKLTPNTKLHISALTRKTQTLFRQNIRNVNITNLDNPENGLPAHEHSTSDHSHGVNLVGDYLHFYRIKASMSELWGAITFDIGRLGDVIDWMRLANEFDEQLLLDLPNEINVEKTMVKIDLLQNKLQDTKKLTTNAQMLSAT